MIANELSGQVAVYYEWKQQLISKIEFYTHWLNDNNLMSFDIEQALDQGNSLLQEDQLTIAMVGEYSRGKTELINALLFSGFGQRILPSQAGRTTMCPTEIYFDVKQPETFLKLLPIETRLKSESIQSLKAEESLWKTINIDSQNPEQIANVLTQLAATREIDLEEAKLLGFDQRMLETLPNKPDKVLIPVWRHALLSLDNPLLRKGIRFLDTPGLNALGSEPELTISMLPKAQAVIFLLSADAGVTASDMSIWKQFIDSPDANHRAGRYAVLNKIDVLWDDLQGEDHVLSSILRVRQNTAEQLGIDLDDVIAVSAKQALIGKVKKDEELVQRSELPYLENIIAQRILVQKETVICNDFVSDFKQMLHGSMAILNQRLVSMNERLEALEQPDRKKKMIGDLARQSHEEHERYYKKLITLKSSRRLMNSQGEILEQLISPLRFKALLKKTKRAMHDSWSTLGLMHTMTLFFRQMEKELENMILEARLADKMVSVIYQRFKADIDAQHLQPKVFNIEQQKVALKNLKAKLMQFCRQPKMFMTEQSILIEHFFSTFVSEVEIIQQEVYEIALNWPDRALMPLMQYAQEQKKNLENQLIQLKRLANSSREMKVQQSELEKVIKKTEQELVIAKELQQGLNFPRHLKLAISN
ncbi:MAG: succinate dehydrogenase flavin-adding protein (antitoxin of CptAB toxin-antitoxin module) [Oleiphilaceae bacterium]|jgi:succinate dehydrogenase flavin-adding protein (antitoxin of CptAB toxin-antitoxin module)